MKVNGYEIKSNANLRGANLWGANLSYVDLRCANLSDANLSGANLSGANLSYADLSSANLSYAGLSGADLSSANLSSVDLSSANLSSANLSLADLIGANLSYANLSGANLWGANLRGADLSSANLSSVDLSSADLSGAMGLLNSLDWLIDNFKTDRKGRLIVYKAFGDTIYNQPDNWNIRLNAAIRENVDSCRAIICGCGINFATLDWIKKTYKDKIQSGNVIVRRCYIKPFTEIVVPYNTDGKARCAELIIGRKIK